VLGAAEPAVEEAPKKAEKKEEEDEEEQDDVKLTKGTPKISEKKISWHIGKEEVDQVTLPAAWPLGPKRVLQEAGSVAVARRLLKENRDEQAKLEALEADLMDRPAFDRKVDARVSAIGKETASGTLAVVLGKMWKDMRKMQTPALLPFVAAQQKELEEEEPELVASLDGKAEKFQKKWTRSILKVKSSKDAALLGKAPWIGAPLKVQPDLHPRSAAAPRSLAAAAAATVLALVLGA